MGLKQDLKEVWTLGGLSIAELGKRVGGQISEDEVTGYAAQLAYYFLFAIFPFFLFLTALLGYVPIPDLMDRIMAMLAGVLPGQALSLVEGTLGDVVNKQRGGLLSFGILVAIWTASNAVASIMVALNRAYGVSEARPFWKARLIAILLTIGLALFLLVSMLLLIFGPQLGNWIAQWVGLGEAFTLLWNVLRWPVILFLVIFSVALVYYFAPNVEQSWKWITPGSVLAVLGWLLASLGFSFYVNNFGDYNATYGSIGAVIVLLTWMYLTAFFLLVGGEINSVIEDASAHGKSRGQREEPAAQT